MIDLEATGLALTAEQVGQLSPDQRRERVRRLIALADLIAYDSEAEHAENHRIVARVILFSGGNDSTVLAHLMRSFASHAAHANTGIGIEATRQFVRDTCASWGLPLIEKHPPVSYRELVVEQGFPGPAQHFKMYQRLKERCLRQVRNDLLDNPRRERVVFYAGRRRQESARRANVPMHERDGSVIWCSPMVLWTALDVNTYLEMHPDLVTNPVPRLVHMSGECLCGAFAAKHELEEIGFWFPEVRTEIEELEEAVAAAGHKPERCKWGWGAYRDDIEELMARAPATGPMCTSCDARRG